MGVSAVSSTQAAYVGEYASSAKKTSERKAEVKEEAGAVYETGEKNSKPATYSVNRMSAEERANLVSQLKADAEARQSQFVSMVQKMMGEQVGAFGQANNIWQFLAKGNFTVDPATKLQAEQDISEDGYYGVKQTAQRIFDFASALAGDDVDKMKEMQAAFEKGFKMAEKTWGGKLPDISYETQGAVSKMFEDYYASKAEA